MAEPVHAEAAEAGHELTATTEVPGGAEHHAEPSALGLGPVAWVSLSMAILIAIALFLKAPKMLLAGLDASIAEIRKQLAEAKALRAEAEALRAEYASKIANAEKDAAAMIEHAGHEAEAIIAKAETDAASVIARREKMAEDKILAAELSAISELRARAAAAATTAARGLIAKNHDAKADKVLVDQAIADI